MYIKGVHDKWAESLAIDGLIDVEIAKRMGIAKSTLNKWKREHPEFMDSLKATKEIADSKVKEPWSSDEDSSILIHVH